MTGAFMFFYCFVFAETFFPVKFAILIAGFPSRSSCHVSLMNIHLSIPVLHVYGSNDERVTPGKIKILFYESYSTNRQICVEMIFAVSY